MRFKEGKSFTPNHQISKWQNYVSNPMSLPSTSYCFTLTEKDVICLHFTRHLPCAMPCAMSLDYRVSKVKSKKSIHICRTAQHTKAVMILVRTWGTDQGMWPFGWYSLGRKISICVWWWRWRWWCLLNYSSIDSIVDGVNISFTLSWEKCQYPCCVSECRHVCAYKSVHAPTHSQVIPPCVTAQDLENAISALNKTSFLSFLPVLRDKPNIIQDNLKS